MQKLLRRASVSDLPDPCLHSTGSALRRSRPETLFQKAFWQQPMDRVDNEVFSARRNATGAIVIPERILRLIAAFAENSARGNIAGHVMGVGSHPQTRWVKLAFEAQGIIDYHFAREENHGKLVAKIPRLRII